MDGSFVTELAKITIANAQVIEVDGEKYVNNPLGPIKLEKKIPKATTIKLNTLRGLVHMIGSEAALYKCPLYVCIDDFNKVSVRSSFDEKRDREIPFAAEYSPVSFNYGRAYDYENFVIALRSQFTKTADSDALIALVSKITNANETEVADDGVSQIVKTKTGVSLNTMKTINPIVKLMPYRTFLDVTQPESEFLFRIKDGAFFLFEADGGMWKMAAKNAISEFLHGELSEKVSSGEIVIVE